MKKLLSIIIAISLTAGILSSCSKPSKNQEEQTVRIGIMTDVDSLPFIIAMENGYFKDAGVNAELEVFKSAADRDSAFQSGNVDGVVSDMLAVALAYNGGFGIKITSHTDGRYIFLSSKQSNAKSIADLKDKEIGISQNTIIEYSVDAMLKSEGMSPSDVKKTAIPQMPVRLEMLRSGKIAGACLPDPLATLAEKDGAVAVGDTAKSGTVLGVMMFSDKAIETKKEGIRKVYGAYERAKEELNKNGDKYRSLLVDKAGFPEEVKDIIKFPEYKKSFIPSKSNFDEVVSWLKDKKLIDKDIDYSSVVTEEFIK